MIRRQDYLLCDHAAGDAIAGVARGVGLVVVSFGVDHDGGATVAEKRIHSVAESHVVILERKPGFSFGIDREVPHVAGVVPFWTVQPMLLARRIEMRSGGFEIRRIALGSLMKVDGMLARWKINEIQFQNDARALLR